MNREPQPRRVWEAVRCPLACLLLLSLNPPAAAGRDIETWTPRDARGACTALANLAVRRATVLQLVFTQPTTHRQGAWKLTGFVKLTGAPHGLKRAPFTCTFTRSGDGFSVNPISLVMGP